MGAVANQVINEKFFSLILHFCEIDDERHFQYFIFSNLFPAVFGVIIDINAYHFVKHFPTRLIKLSSFSFSCIGLIQFTFIYIA